MLSHVSRVQLFATPPGSSVHRILQARILEWVAMPSSRESSAQGSNPYLLHLLHWQTGSLPRVPPGKPSCEHRFEPNDPPAYPPPRNTLSRRGWRSVQEKVGEIEVWVWMLWGRFWSPTEFPPLPCRGSCCSFEGSTQSPRKVKGRGLWMWEKLEAERVAKK